MKVQSVINHALISNVNGLTQEVYLKLSNNSGFHVISVSFLGKHQTDDISDGSFNQHYYIYASNSTEEHK